MEIAREIAARELLLIVTPEPHRVEARIADEVNMDNVRWVQCNTNDTWARDHGGITVLADGEPVICDFAFNGWGLKFPACHDNLITSHCYRAGVFDAAYANKLNFVIEGGSVESDGRGTLLTTSQCLLSPNRNGEWDRDHITHYLCDTLGAGRVLWLDNGFLMGDDTDSHIDTLARLAPYDTILYVRCDDPADPHYGELRAMERTLTTFKTAEGKPYRLLPLPMAAPAYDGDGMRLPATYANFLVLNGAVLFPTYASHEKDEQARQVIEAAFPDREVVGIDCRTLICQHGSLHCVTMQYPAGVLL